MYSICQGLGITQHVFGDQHVHASSTYKLVSPLCSPDMAFQGSNGLLKLLRSGSPDPVFSLTITALGLVRLCTVSSLWARRIFSAPGSLWPHGLRSVARFFRRAHTAKARNQVTLYFKQSIPV